MEEWDSVKNELNEIGPIDLNQALEPNFLRQCFSTLLVSVDNKQRRRIETFLKRLTSKPEIIFVLSNLILQDPDVNIRAYAASYLSNETPRFIDSIIEANTSDKMFETLGNILFTGLSNIELSNNLRSFLLKGLGNFMAKTFPDIWEDAIERITNNPYNSAYVFESLAIFAQASRSLPINFNAKQAREALMWKKFTTIIGPYTMNILSQPTNVFLWEKLAFMLAEWLKMRDPLMNVIRPIINKIIENGCYNPRSLSTLISGFNELDIEMSESRLYMCIVLTNHVQQPLLEAIQRIVKDSSAGFEDDEAINITELVHVICEFYANVMNRSSRAFLFRPTDNMELQKQHEAVIGKMFDFASQILAWCHTRFDIFNAVGIFYSTIQQTLADDFYQIENFLAEIMLTKGYESVPYVFQASIISDIISFGSSDHEEILQCREIFLDLFLLLDALSLKLDNELLSHKYTELLKKVVETRDLHCVSAMLSYFKELPFNVNHVDILMHLNLSSHNLDFSAYSDEQTIDFFQNYFGFIACLFNSKEHREKYSNLINETIGIAMCFLINRFKPSISPEVQQHARALIHHEKNESLFVVECFKFVNDFTTNVKFDSSLRQELFYVCSNYIQERNNREAVKLATKCIASCTTEEHGAEGKKIALYFFESIFNILLKFGGEQQPSDLTIQKEYIEDVVIFCSSLSESVKSGLSIDLGDIIWRTLSLYMDKNMDPEVILPLVNPFLTLISPEVYTKFAEAVPNYTHKYPELISKILKSSLERSEEFVLSNVMPVIFNYVWSVFSVTTFKEEVQDGEQATLELVFVFFRRHTNIFYKYLATLSSISSVQTFITAALGLALKSVKASFSDEGIVRGLRVIEVIMELRNDDVLSCFNESHVHIMPAVLDIVFSVYFSCSQMSIAKILFFYSHYSPSAFKSQLLSHKVGTMKGADLLLAERVTRPLILKQIILWNADWQKQHD